MAVTQDKSGPYAPAAAVIDIMTRYRERGLPSPINADVLLRAGISDSLVPRTLQTLQALDLIDDQGKPTTAFEGLRRAPEGEYKERMVEWLNQAYAEIIEFANPATDDEVKVRDAFRNYKPFGQHARMVSLFMGLYKEAGVISERPSQPRAQKSPARHRNPPSKRSGKIKSPSSNKGESSSFAGGSVPAPLSGMLAKLPSEGQGWTKETRDKFMLAFGSVLDFCFPITEPVGPDQAGSDNGEE